MWTWGWVQCEHEVESNVNMRLSPTWTWGWVPLEHEVESNVNMRLSPMWTWGWVPLDHMIESQVVRDLQLASEMCPTLCCCPCRQNWFLAINFLPRLLLRHTPHIEQDKGSQLWSYYENQNTVSSWAGGSSKQFSCTRPSRGTTHKNCLDGKNFPRYFLSRLLFSSSLAVFLPFLSVCGWCFREVTDSPNMTNRLNPSYFTHHK